MSVSMRTIVTFAVAIFLGIVAVALTRTYLAKATRTTGVQVQAEGMVPVVVAAQALDRGAVLQPDMLKVVNFPGEAAPANAFHNVSDLTGGKDQQRLVLRAMVSNEPVLVSNVSGPGGKLNLSSTVAAGMRAVTLRSSDVIGVGGFVLPGDRVDVLLTRSMGAANDATKMITQVLAEDVRVLGVDQSANEEADKPVVSKAITVEVTPEQAQSISLGQTVGTVSLTLRRVADETPLVRKSMGVSDLNPAPRKVVARPAAPVVHVFRGTEASPFSLSVSGGFQRVTASSKAAVMAP